MPKLKGWIHMAVDQNPCCSTFKQAIYSRDDHFVKGTVRLVWLPLVIQLPGCIPPWKYQQLSGVDEGQVRHQENSDANETM